MQEPCISPTSCERKREQWNAPPTRSLLFTPEAQPRVDEEVVDESPSGADERNSDASNPVLHEDDVESIWRDVAHSGLSNAYLSTLWRVLQGQSYQDQRVVLWLIRELLNSSNDSTDSEADTIVGDEEDD